MTGWTASVLRSLITRVFLAELGFKKLDNMGMTPLLLLFLFYPIFSFLTVGGILSCSYAFLLCLFGF